MSFIWSDFLFEDIFVGGIIEKRVFIKHTEPLEYFLSSRGIEYTDDIGLKLIAYLSPYTMSSKQIRIFFKYYADYDSASSPLQFYNFLWTNRYQPGIEFYKYLKRLQLIVKHIMSTNYLRYFFLNYKFRDNSYNQNRERIYSTVYEDLKYDKSKWNQEFYIICRNEIIKCETLSEIIFKRITKKSLYNKFRQKIDKIIYLNPFYFFVMCFFGLMLFFNYIIYTFFCS